MQVTRDGAPVTGFAADAARALLAYLALHTERPVPRDTLAGLLWPEWPNTDALRNLRTALYRLRDAIGDRDADPPYLDITRHTLQLSPDAGVQIDALAFSSTIAAVRAHSHASLTGCPACQERLTEAVRLYRGDLLDGFALDSAPFEEWLVVQREALHQQALWALEQLADHCEAQGDHDHALSHARRQIALEPWRERAHRQAMRALARSRHRAAALAQNEACRQSLSDELGIEPEPRTRDLYERIRAGSFPPPEKVAPEPAERAPVAAPAPVSVPSAQAEPDAAPAPPTPTPPARPTPGALPALEGECRRFTLLLVDIPGSVDLLAEVGAEDWAEVIGPAMHLLAGEARRLGADVQQTRPDALVATFGATVTHEDDAERAVLAALAMQQALRTFANEMDSSLTLRISVHTGEAIVSAFDGTPTLLGAVRTGADAVHASLPHGALRVDDATYRAVAPIFAWRDSEDGAHTPLAHHPGADKGRGLPGLSSPLVGRDRETQALQEALARLRAGVGGIVTVVGEAGIGKSRLVAEARAAQPGSGDPASSDWPELESPSPRNSIDDRSPLRPVSTPSRKEARSRGPSQRTGSHSVPTPLSQVAQSPPIWLEGRCLSYTTHVAYQMWGDVLRAVAEVPSDPAPEQVRDGLRRASRALCPDQFDDVYPLLVWMLGLPRDDVTETRIRGIDAEGLRVLAFRAVETLLEHAAAQTPLVVALEDLHWADATSLALLEHLLPSTEHAPLLFLCVMRPETEHGCWHFREVAARDHYHRHTDLRLNPLTADESTALVGNLLSVEDLPADLRDRVLARAEGNPFFLEEILRALIDDGAIAFDETSGRWIATRPVDDLPLPATLHGVIATRIDRLPREAKQVLQLAAVIGRIVPRPLLAAIAGDDALDEHLAALQRAQLLRERSRLPEVELIFKHALTQEAAYASLLRRKRRTLHRRVAEAIEARYADRIDEHLGILAHHWEQAGDTERAIDYLRRAGVRASAQFANQDAVDYYTRALCLLPDGSLEARFALRLAREAVLDRLGHRTRQREELAALATAADDLGDNSKKLAVAIREAHLSMRLSEYESAGQAARLAVHLAQELDDDPARARALREWARFLFYRNRSPEAIPVLQEARVLAERHNLLDVLISVFHTLGTSSQAVGAVADAEDYFRQELHLCRQVGDRAHEGEALRDLGGAHGRQGRYKDAINLHKRAITACRSTGDLRNEGWALLRLGETACDSGDLELGRVSLESALRIDSIRQEGLAKWRCLGGLAQVCNAAGRHEEAQAYCERGLHENFGDLTRRYGGLSLELGRALGAQGQTGLAKHHAQDALSTMSSDGWPERAVTLAQADLVLASTALGETTSAAACGDQIDYAGWIGGPPDDHPSSYRWSVQSLRVGRAALVAGRCSAAMAVFGEVAAFVLPSQPDLACQAAAGLAATHQAQGDLGSALACVAEVLELLQTRPDLAATEELTWAHLVCYRILAAAGDPRASDLLADAHGIVLARAADIEDPAARSRFLGNVPVNREVVEAWQRLHPSA